MRRTPEEIKAESTPEALMKQGMANMQAVKKLGSDLAALGLSEFNKYIRILLQKSMADISKLSPEAASHHLREVRNEYDRNKKLIEGLQQIVVLVNALQEKITKAQENHIISAEMAASWKQQIQQRLQELQKDNDFWPRNSEGRLGIPNTDKILEHVNSHLIAALEENIRALEREKQAQPASPQLAQPAAAKQQPSSSSKFFFQEMGLDKQQLAKGSPPLPSKDQLQTMKPKKPVYSPEQKAPAAPKTAQQIVVEIIPYQPDSPKDAAIQLEFTSAQARDDYRKQLLGGKKIKNYFDIFKQEDKGDKYILRIAAEFESKKEIRESDIDHYMMPGEITPTKQVGTPNLPKGEVMDRWEKLMDGKSLSFEPSTPIKKEFNPDMSKPAAEDRPAPRRPGM